MKNQNLVRYMPKISFLFLALLGFRAVNAQQVLSLESAIAIAMENNYNVQIAQEQIAAAENEIYKGNAGMTPTIDWNTNVNGNLSQVNQVFLDDRKINRLGQSFSPNTQLQLNWTLYDGRRMQAQLENLKSQGQLTQIQKRLVMLQTMAQVMQTYYQIQRLDQSVGYLKKIIGYYEDRLKLTEERWQIGRGSKLDYLQSKTDLSVQQSDLANVINQLNVNKIELNKLLARDPEEDFVVSELSELAPAYSLAELIEKSKTNNQELLVLQKNREISLINQQIASSFLKPRIGLNSSFGYNFNKNNAGFLAINQSLGLGAGVSATWNVFNGHQTQRNIQAAKIQTSIIDKRKESLLNDIENDITQAYQQYLNDIKVLEIEKENSEVTDENLKISLEKFRLGASTILEYNEAQRRYDASLTRLVNARFNLRISELELLRISGLLLQ